MRIRPSPFKPSPPWDKPCDRDGCADWGAWHVLWTSAGEAGFMCSVHMDDVVAGYVFAAHHQTGPGCRLLEPVWGHRECSEAPVVPECVAEEPVE